MIKIVNISLSIVAMVFILLGLSLRVQQPAMLPDDVQISYAFNSGIPSANAPNIIKSNLVDNCTFNYKSYYTVAVLNTKPQLLKILCK